MHRRSPFFRWGHVLWVRFVVFVSEFDCKIDIDCAFALETKQPFTLHMQVSQLATMWIHTKILTLNQ